MARRYTPVLYGFPPADAMIAEVATAYESVKAATTIVRGLSSLNTKAEVNQAVIELQGHLLDTQHNVMQLQEKLQEMKARIESLERFSPERFRLEELVHAGHRFSGRRAYVEIETGIPFCPGCFTNNKLTPVQFNSTGKLTSTCKNCGTSLGGADDWSPRV